MLSDGIKFGKWFQMIKVTFPKSRVNKILGCNEVYCIWYCYEVVLGRFRWNKFNWVRLNVLS